MLDDLHINIAGGLDIPMPGMARVRQNFEEHRIEDVAAAVTEQVSRPEIQAKIKPGARIAVGVGSRGVANIATAVKALVGCLKAAGAEPFVFPAMGSHGGATVEGQTGLLAGYGVTESAIGAPVRATMETVVPAHMDDGTPVHMDKFASEADGVVLINRVKPHTNFRGDIESGVVKMMIIGMGKIAGATAIHGGYPMTEFATVLPAAAKALMAKTNFLFGVGLVEDAYDQTAIVEAMAAETLFAQEAALQAKAKVYMARINFDEIDVLVIDQIGKEISGAGADPNVTGRNLKGVPGFDKPNIKKLVLLDLTEKTMGNATGLGAADVITRRLLNRVDFPVTYANIVTSTYLDGGRIPIPMKDGDEAVRLAVKTLTGTASQDARIVRIRNTLDLGEIAVSAPMVGEARDNAKLDVLTDPEPMAYEAAA